MYEALYDEYAGRLHGYCWSLVGDAAPGAVRDAFVTAARQGGPRRPLRSAETELWLYGLARRACLQRDTNPRPAGNDPLARAVAGLRPDQREALYLSASGLLEDHQIARVLGVAADTVGQLIRTGRSRLEHGVLDVLLPGPMLPEYQTLLMAFETGTLDALFASRIPEHPAPSLRETVLAACAEEIGHPLGNPRGRASLRPLAEAPQDRTPASPTTDHPRTLETPAVSASVLRSGATEILGSSGEAPRAPRPGRSRRIVGGRGRKVTTAVTLAASGVLAASLLTTLITTGAGNGVLPSGSRHGMPPGAAQAHGRSANANTHGSGRPSGALHGSAGPSGTSPGHPGASGTGAPNPSLTGSVGQPADPKSPPPGTAVPPTATAGTPSSSPSASPTPTPTPSASATPTPTPSP
jgi:DNA-directed RNA polymerase specialized sigma24 family protein